MGCHLKNLWEFTFKIPSYMLYLTFLLIDLFLWITYIIFPESSFKLEKSFKRITFYTLETVFSKL